MPYENISAALTATAITNINTAINTIRANMPFVVNLTSEERASLLKMGDKSLAFVTKAREYAKSNKNLVPLT